MWFDDLDQEDDLGLLSKELEDLEDDEVSLREAAFIEGYSRALNTDEEYDPELDDWA